LEACATSHYQGSGGGLAAIVTRYSPR
jgi:hypothetical protein